MNLGGLNIDVQLLSSHMEYEFNILYLTMYSLLDIKVGAVLEGASGTFAPDSFLRPRIS